MCRPTLGFIYLECYLRCVLYLYLFLSLQFFCNCQLENVLKINSINRSECENFLAQHVLFLPLTI